VVRAREAPPAADHSAIYASDAYRRGVARAEADGTVAPPSGDVLKLTVQDGYGRAEFLLCLLCGWGRGSGRCPHA
jgi:hypothetical protein